jgi:signal transduction histidine kinase
MEDDEVRYDKALADMSLLFDWVRSRDSSFLNRLAELEQKEDQLDLAQEQITKARQETDHERQKLARLLSYLSDRKISISDDILDPLPF